MHAAPARYVSVSELYSTDEVELLLDEIRELEPTSCRGEDVQDFEIAGSGLGACGAGGRSPCGTELTERSWDSHAHYSRAPPPHARRVAPLYCRPRHLLELPGAVALLVVLCSAAACGCVWALVGLRAWLLPLAARVRLLQLAALSSAMLHAALLFVHITRLAALLPLDWHRLSVLSCLWSGVLLSAGGALTLHAVLASAEYRLAPRAVRAPLAAGAALALGGAGAALARAALAALGWWRARRPAPPAPPPAAYRAVPSAPPAPPPAARAGPSTSRDDPL